MCKPIDVFLSLLIHAVLVSAAIALLMRIFPASEPEPVYFEILPEVLNPPAPEPSLPPAPTPAPTPTPNPTPTPTPTPHSNSQLPPPTTTPTPIPYNSDQVVVSSSSSSSSSALSTCAAAPLTKDARATLELQLETRTSLQPSTLQPSPPSPPTTTTTPYNSSPPSPPTPTTAPALHPNCHLTPDYPRSARRHGHQGRATVEATVTASGSVEEVTLVESTGYDELDRAAVRAVRSAEFLPATTDNRPTAGRIRLPIEFRLSAP